MAIVQLAKNAYTRTAANLPVRQLKNRYVEADPSNLITGYMVLPRPGLASFATVGDGPYRAVFRQSGVLNGDWLVLSGSALYRVTIGGSATLIGTVGGSDLVEMASDGTNVFIAAGGLYLYDGSALTTVSVPDGLSITSIAYLSGYFVLQVAEVGKFFWIQPGEITIDPLDFATAERSPDAGVAIRLQGDFLVLMQAQGEEFWVTTGDADAPFQRQSGIVSEKGCTFRQAAVEIDNGRMWVSDDSTDGRIVVKSGQGAPTRVSVHGIEELMRGAETISASVFTFDGHLFYVLRIEGVGTFAYDISTETWSEFASYGETNWWPICCGQAPGGPVLLGSGLDGKLYTLDAGRGNDDGMVIQRVVTGIIPVPMARMILDKVEIFGSQGWSPSLTLTPKITLSIAKDGFTFSDPAERDLGARGQYGKPVVWNRRGEIRRPQCVLVFADSDDFAYRISHVTYNEP